MNHQHKDQQANNEQHSEPAPKWYQVVGSVLAAAFGVQSKKNRERDFQHGKPVVFVVAGILFTVMFVIGMMVLVSAVVKTAG